MTTKAYKIGEEVEVLMKTTMGRKWIPAKVKGFSTANEPCVELLLQPAHPLMLHGGNQRLIKRPRLIRKLPAH